MLKNPPKAKKQACGRKHRQTCAQVRQKQHGGPKATDGATHPERDNDQADNNERTTRTKQGPRKRQNLRSPTGGRDLVTDQTRGPVDRPGERLRIARALSL